MALAFEPLIVARAAFYGCLRRRMWRKSAHWSGKTAGLARFGLISARRARLAATLRLPLLVIARTALCRPLCACSWRVGALCCDETASLSRLRLISTQRARLAATLRLVLLVKARTAPRRPLCACGWR
eukprot:4877065-Prymnesium_polylepis.1